jgi:hypothetical protein
MSDDYRLGSQFDFGVCNLFAGFSDPLSKSGHPDGSSPARCFRRSGCRPCRQRDVDTRHRLPRHGIDHNAFNACLLRQKARTKQQRETRRDTQPSHLPGIS